MIDQMPARVLDSHCHAWRVWPYAPLVPDELHRGTIDQLIYEMDLHGVAEALVVCARIDNNFDNVDYVAFARDRYTTRLRLVADLDCTWSSTHHVPGSAERLVELDDRYDLEGFTHYVHRDNDGWLRSEEAERVFEVAARRGLLVSLAASTAWQADLREIASRYPSVPVLCHHLGGIRTDAGLGPEALAPLLESAAVPNIYVKVSGFHYAATLPWDYPWPAVVRAFRLLYDEFGAGRLCWASDFPASTRYTTYRQTVEVVRTHCDFLSAADLNAIFGGTLQSIFARPRP